MTSEEMEELKGIAASMGLYDDKNPCKRAVILGKAIKELEQEPCDTCGYEEGSIYCKEHCPHEAKIEQEPCEEAISRQAVLASIKNLYPDMPIMDIMGARRKWLEKYAPYFECENAIEQLPFVKPQEPKTGHWMIDEDSTDRFFATYECSCCKRAIIIPHDAMKAVYKDYPYCHCGAKMQEGEE